MTFTNKYTYKYTNNKIVRFPLFIKQISLMWSMECIECFDLIVVHCKSELILEAYVIPSRTSRGSSPICFTSCTICTRLESAELRPAGSHWGEGERERERERERG